MTDFLDSVEVDVQDLGVSRIGDYRVLGHWATGLVSHIYVARHEDDPKRLYALKVPRTQHAVYAVEGGVRLRGGAPGKEAPHPHTISPREVLDRNGRLYMVTDFVNGELLSRVLAARSGEPWPPSLALMVALHVAKSLAHIHTQKTDGAFQSHEEVCPANITLGYDGRARLLDAAIVGSQRRGFDARYAAPEVAAELPDLDARCDVYSLGLVLWEMLTGHAAVNGLSATELRAAALEGRISAPSAAGAHCDEAIDTMVMTALNNERDERYPSAQGFLDALAGHLARIAPKRDPEADMREVLQRVFPLGASKLPRLIQRWNQDPEGHRLHRPEGPLSAIQEALRAQGGATSTPAVAALAVTPTAVAPTPAEPSVDVEGAPANPKRRVVLGLLAVGGAAAAVGLALFEGDADVEGTLHIATDPEGATVEIDGQNQGRTPLIVPGLQPSTDYLVEISKTGFEPQTRRIRLDARGQVPKLNVVLKVLSQPKPNGKDTFKDNPY